VQFAEGPVQTEEYTHRIAADAIILLDIKHWRAPCVHPERLEAFRPGEDPGSPDSPGLLREAPHKIRNLRSISRAQHRYRVSKHIRKEFCMARKSPAERRRRMNQVVHAWEDLARNSRFSGMSVDDFEAEMQQSAVAHARVEDLRRELRHALAARDEVDTRCMALVYRVGWSVGGDPDFGCDSTLLEAMGFTRETVRRMRIRRGMRRRTKPSKGKTPSLADETSPCDATPNHPATLG
jgi:hypothetical protein